MTTKEKSLTKGFLIIPQEILTTVKYKGKVLGFPEKALYSYLAHWSKGHDKVFPSSKTMCEDLGIGSRNSFKKYINKLEELQLISVEKVKGRSSIYTILPFDGYEIKKVCTPSITRGTNQEKQIEPTVKPNTKHTYQEVNPFDLEDDWELDELPF